MGKVRRRYKFVAIIFLTIVVGVIINVGLKYTTFAEVLIDHLNIEQISSIEITKTSALKEDEITVTDQSQIESIMNDLSEIKLREISNIGNAQDAKYWMILKINNVRKYGISLYDNKYLALYQADLKKNEYKTYEITNEFDPKVIRSLFK